MLLLYKILNFTTCVRIYQRTYVKQIKAIAGINRVMCIPEGYSWKGFVTAFIFAYIGVLSYNISICIQ